LRFALFFPVVEKASQHPNIEVKGYFLLLEKTTNRASVMFNRIFAGHATRTWARFSSSGIVTTALRTTRNHSNTKAAIASVFIIAGILGSGATLCECNSCKKSKEVSHLIDHTILKPTTLVRDIETVCAEARSNSFAAVCVPPNYVVLAKSLLVGTDVKTATVIGFPFGYSSIQAKMAEVRRALNEGCDEVDVVANISAIKNGDWHFLIHEIHSILPIVRKHKKAIKVIIESGVLTDEEIIKCCEIYGQAGIDFLKTSTGYADKGASVEAVRLFRAHLPPNVRIKASGGIRTYEFAKQLVDAGADRLGCSASVAIAAGEKAAASQTSSSAVVKTQASTTSGSNSY
jgi:deoxyribose-phosphate aldolase